MKGYECFAVDVDRRCRNFASIEPESGERYRRRRQQTEVRVLPPIRLASTKAMVFTSMTLFDNMSVNTLSHTDGKMTCPYYRLWLNRERSRGRLSSALIRYDLLAMCASETGSKQRTRGRRNLGTCAVSGQRGLLHSGCARSMLMAGAMLFMPDVFSIHTLTGFGRFLVIHDFMINDLTPAGDRVGLPIRVPDRLGGPVSDKPLKNTHKYIVRSLHHRQ